MSDPEYDYTVDGEVVKVIHGELPAVRWTCAGCGEDACTIFYEPGEREKVVVCETCNSSSLVRRAESS
jgi:hypothetical protein